LQQMIRRSQITCLGATPGKASQLYNASLKSSKLKLLIESRLLATIIYNIYQLPDLKGLQLWRYWSKSLVIALCLSSDYYCRFPVITRLMALA
jgi:hypothetical protein